MQWTFKLKSRYTWGKNNLKNPLKCIEGLYKFLNDNNVIYPLKFGFRQRYSTSFPLINLTETIKEVLDQGKYGCGIFVDLQKPFDTVDHNIMGKLKHCGIRGVNYSWFQSYLKGRKQYVSINGFNSKDLPISYEVPQGSVLAPLLFLLYINDLHPAIKFCKVHHFADDTNLLHISKSIKACACYSLSNFYFSPSDSPSKTMKNVFYFI